MNFYQFLYFYVKHLYDSYKIYSLQMNPWFIFDTSEFICYYIIKKPLYIMSQKNALYKGMISRDPAAPGPRKTSLDSLLQAKHF